MARNFLNSGGHEIGLSSGAIGSSMAFGPGTVAAIVRTSADTLSRNIFGTGTWSFYKTGGTKLSLWTGAGERPTASSYITVAMGWVLVAATRAAGTGKPRYHRYRYDDNSWNHSDPTGTDQSVGSTAGANLWLGSYDGTTEWWDGDIAIVGVWDRQMTDTEVEALAFSLQAWYASEPLGGWILDQSSTSQKVIDFTGNGANQSSINTTTISTGSVPGFSYGAGIIIPGGFETGVAETEFTPSGFTVGVTFGDLGLDLDTGITLDGISVPVTLGSVVLEDLDTGVAPSGIAVPVTLGDITITESGFFPDGFTVAVTLGTPSFAQTVEFTPSGIAVPVTFGSVVLEDLDTGITLSGIAVPVTFGTISTSLDFEYAPSGIAVPVTFGTEALSLVTGITPSGIAVSVAVGTFGASFATVRITSLTLHYPQRVEVIDFTPRSAILQYAPSGWTVIME